MIFFSQPQQPRNNPLIIFGMGNFLVFDIVPLRLVSRNKEDLSQVRTEIHRMISTFPLVKVFRATPKAKTFMPFPGASVSSRYDFIFFGNYWNVPQAIVEFNPSELSTFRGALIGNGWLVNSWTFLFFFYYIFKDSPVATKWRNLLLDNFSDSNISEVCPSFLLDCLSNPIVVSLNKDTNRFHE